MHLSLNDDWKDNSCLPKQATTHENIRQVLEYTGLWFSAKDEPITFCGAKRSWMWMHQKSM